MLGLAKFPRGSFSSSFKSFKFSNSFTPRNVGVTFTTQISTNSGRGTSFPVTLPSPKTAQSQDTHKNVFHTVEQLRKAMKETPEGIKSAFAADAIVGWSKYKSLDKVLNFWIRIANQEGGEDDLHEALCNATAFAILFSTHPNELTKSVTKLRNVIKEKRKLFFICMGLWHMQTKEAIDVLKEIAKKEKLTDYLNFSPLPSKRYQPTGPTLKQEVAKFLTTQPPWTHIDEVQVVEPGSLDQLWIHYYLTGERSSVERIVPYMEKMKTDEQLSSGEYKHPMLEPSLIGHIATWSVLQNAMQRPAILQLCEEIYCKNTTLKPEVKGLLFDVLLGIHSSEGSLSFPSPAIWSTHLKPHHEAIIKAKASTLWEKAHYFPPNLDEDQLPQCTRLAKWLIGIINKDKIFYELSHQRLVLAAKVYIAAYNLHVPEAVFMKGNHVVDVHAVNWLEKALDKEPDDMETNKLTGGLLAQLGEHEQAAEYLNKVRQLGDNSVLYTLGTMFVEKNPKKAIQYFEEYRKLYPDNEIVEKLLEEMKTNPGKVTIQRTPFGGAMPKYPPEEDEEPE